jgi:hypothetical protein
MSAANKVWKEPGKAVSATQALAVGTKLQPSPEGLGRDCALTERRRAGPHTSFVHGDRRKIKHLFIPPPANPTYRGRR